MMMTAGRGANAHLDEGRRSRNPPFPKETLKKITRTQAHAVRHRGAGIRTGEPSAREKKHHRRLLRKPTAAPRCEFRWRRPLSGIGAVVSGQTIDRPELSSSKKKKGQRSRARSDRPLRRSIVFGAVAKKNEEADADRSSGRTGGGVRYLKFGAVRTAADRVANAHRYAAARLSVSTDVLSVGSGRPRWKKKRNRGFFEATLALNGFM